MFLISTVQNSKRKLRTSFKELHFISPSYLPIKLCENFHAFNKSAGSLTFLRPIITSLRKTSASFNPDFSISASTFLSVPSSNLVDHVFLTKVGRYK